ncbi:hypothetical protein ACJZ2D_000275 [Fusarium nematophilum]
MLGHSIEPPSRDTDMAGSPISAYTEGTIEEWYDPEFLKDLNMRWCEGEAIKWAYIEFRGAGLSCDFARREHDTESRLAKLFEGVIKEAEAHFAENDRSEPLWRSSLILGVGDAAYKAAIARKDGAAGSGCCPLRRRCWPVA